MALQLQDLMMRLNPGPAMPAFTGGDSDQIEMQKQHLQLMQQEFENTKQHQQQELALQQLAASARMAHEKAQQDRLLADEKAKRDAETQKRQQEVLGKFTELNGKGQIQEARAMLPLLNAAGLDVSLEGEDNGLPRYRIGPDPEAAARDSGDIGYPTTDSGTMAPPPAVTSTEDAFSRAQAATAQAAATGLPARAPDKPDVSGAVPKNVIDTGALHAETLSSLRPALNSIVAAYPPEFQDAMSHMADAAESSGLPTDKALELLNQLSPGAVTQLRENTKQAFEDRKEQSAEERAAQAARLQAEKLGMQGEKQASAQYKTGAGLGEQAANTYKVADLLERRRAIGLATYVIDNKHTEDDYMVGALISRMMGERGATTENDVGRALGDASMSFLDLIKKRLFKEAMGGLSPEQKGAIRGVLQDAAKEDERRAADYLSNVDETIASPDTHPDVARGLKAYRNLIIPRDIRDRYEATKNPGSTAAVTPQKPFNMADDAAAPSEPEGQGVLTNDPRDWKSQAAAVATQAGLDPKALQGVIQAESGGNPSAQNPSGATGLIQFMPEIAQAMGTTTDAIKKMPVAEQLPLVVQYLKDRGINEKSTQDDMYVAIAAGGNFVGRPDSTVVYPKNSKGWKANPAWRPADGGDITVADIKAYGGGRGHALAASAPSGPVGGSSLEARMQEMRARYGL